MKKLAPDKVCSLNLSDFSEFLWASLSLDFKYISGKNNVVSMCIYFFPLVPAAF